MEKAEEAVALFQQGFNCAQCVLSVFAPDFGIDRDTACRISQGFGAGIARTDDNCGSLAGAIMVIGLLYGGITADEVAAKEKTYAVVGEFLQEFKTLHGAITCTGLLGYNMSDPQQFAQAKTHKIAKERCPAFVRDAVKLIEKVL
jgi:C_GCAxxG_C_C family probable redox protein